MSLKNILKESTTSADNPAGRPDLLDFTRSINNLVYTELVALQPTTQPVSALFGVRYMNANGDMSYTTAATYGGQYGDQYASSNQVAAGSYVAGDMFLLENVLYKVLAPITVSSTAQADVYSFVMQGKVRTVSEAAQTSKFESANAVIQNTNFRLDKWQTEVKTRKLKTEITIETLEDLAAVSVDGEKIMKDFMITMISEDINKDILQKLITVSKRFKVDGLSPNGYLDLSAVEVTDSLLSYRLTRYVAEMAASATRKTGFNPNYVVASSRVAGILQTAGIEQTPGTKSPGFLTKLGMDLYVDTTTPFDYVIVGVKVNDMFDDKMETVGSLVFSPYQEGDKAGMIRVVTDPDSLQNNVMVMSRYSLSVNPYATSQDDFTDIRITQGDDWDNLVGRSDLSMFLGILLPEVLNDDED